MPDKITLRWATAGDEPAIRALVRGARINLFGLHWRRFIVAVDGDGRLVGCGQVKPHRDGSRELASIVVARGRRRQGVAAAIINRLQAEYPPPLWLTCVSRLVPFYEKFSFQEVTAWRQMPYYYRLAKAFFNIFTRLARRRYTLAVMVWPAPAPDPPR